MSLAKLIARELTEAEINLMVSDLVSKFSTLVGLEKIILFGSASRGKMTEASDIDMALIFDTELNARSGYKEAQKRRQKNCWPLDLLCVDQNLYAVRSAIGGVLFVVRTEGKILFERSK